MFGVSAKWFSHDCIKMHVLRLSPVTCEGFWECGFYARMGNWDVLWWNRWQQWVSCMLCKGHCHGKGYLLIQVLEVEKVRLLLLDAV